MARMKRSARGRTRPGPPAAAAPSANGSVLVACPTYAGKAYCLDRWIASLRDLTYAPRAAYMVDNSRGSDAYAKLIRSQGVECDHIEPSAAWEPTFRRSWEKIYRRAVRGGHSWILSLEADVVVGPEALGVLVTVARDAGSEDVTAWTPMRPAIAAATGIPPDEAGVPSLGCALMSTRLVGAALRAWPESGVWIRALGETAYRLQGGATEVRDLFTVEHLDDMSCEYWSFGDPLDPSQPPQLPPAAVWTTPTLRGILAGHRSGEQGTS